MLLSPHHNVTSMNKENKCEVNVVVVESENIMGGKKGLHYCNPFSTATVRCC